jgi:hypothetical protein
MLYNYYLITCKLNDKLNYVGKTKRTLKERIKEHKFNSNFSLVKKYVIIRENGGFDNFECKCIDTLEFENRRDADLHEETLRQTCDATLNKNRCFNTKTDNNMWKQARVTCECGKVFRQDNKSHHIKSQFHQESLKK